MNKRIAEIKGFNVTSNGDVNSPTWWMQDRKTGTRELLKPYDTDIACAMKLWEEMIERGAYYIIKVRKLSKRGEVYRVRIMKENQQLFTGADTEGLNKAISKAIAGAYIKWREG